MAPSRGRKRVRSPRGASQTNTVASASVSMAEPTATSEQPVRKRLKRASSTPAAASSSQQLPTQLQSRRRSRSRAGSPTRDVQCVTPLRASARLACKIRPFMNSGNSDIYTHLADPKSAGRLLSEPPASIISSGPKDLARGRRKKTINLEDENARKNLMEEWARLRQSQGILPLLGIDKNICLSQVHIRDTLKGDISVSTVRLEETTQENSPDPNFLKKQTTTYHVSQSDETVSLLTPMDSKKALPSHADVLGNNHGSSLSLLDAETEWFAAPSKDTTPLTSNTNAVEEFTNDEPIDILQTTHRHAVQQPYIPAPPRCSVSPSREDSVYIEQGSNSATVSETRPLHNVDTHLDSDEEFCMLEIPEIFALPWTPVASNLYVPAGLGKLVSGMREQLTIVVRARRRAEELYEAELTRRISAERIVEELRIRLEEKQKDFSGC